ncbi:hypothetical protein GGTG_09159 [Gaeumannomyces tritici R3-111a-1]|uniref:Uncharacterized protein n=1 Tax=Gaeumannomyces tritici (strain R3-111a-1) TaxID=644352 RepID=J3P6L7_GAET3|nr:hypothetical protein GGTG_09159 [Gaeumannomyces tritici R3-111a-1]EJT72293.1 hypothetical protein GGTG_09159 [Gaeumannomyces tritici R3-111a-1]
MTIPPRFVLGRAPLSIRTKKKCLLIKSTIAATIKDIVGHTHVKDAPYNPANWENEFDFEERARKDVRELRTRHYYIPPEGLYDPATEDGTTQEQLRPSEVQSAAAALDYGWREQSQQAPTLGIFHALTAISLKQVHNLGGEHMGSNMAGQLSLANRKSGSSGDPAVPSDNGDRETEGDGESKVDQEDYFITHRFCPDNVETLQFDEPQLFLDLARGDLMCELRVLTLPVSPAHQSVFTPKPPRRDGRELEHPHNKKQRLLKGKIGCVPARGQQDVPRDWQYWWGRHPGPIQGLMELEGRRYWSDNRFYNQGTISMEPCPDWLRASKSTDHSVKFRPALGMHGKPFRPFQQRMRAFTPKDLAAQGDLASGTGVVGEGAERVNPTRSAISRKLKERLARHQKPLREQSAPEIAQIGAADTVTPSTVSHHDAQADARLSFDDLWNKYGSSEEE